MSDNKVNIQKMYHFIASFNQNGQNWKDVADGYNGAKKDGVILKAEFREFVHGEFANWDGNEGGTVSDDIINQFWKKIDTNTSASKIAGSKYRHLNALDKKELAAMEKTLEAYMTFDEFVKDNVQIPSALTTTGSQWKNAVTSELSVIVEQYIKAGYEGDLKTLLAEALPAIANQNTAEFCAIEYQNVLKSTILAEYPDYDVTQDSTLTSLLAKYLKNNVTAETTADDIKTNIRSIMDAYLATAGLGNGSDYDLASLGFNPNTINGAQKAVIAQNIKNALKDEAKNYEGFEEYFNEAVQKFIDFKIQSGGNFETLKNCGAEFLNSTFKTELDNLVSFEKTYRDVTTESDFYKKLVEKYGQSVADLIANDDRYLAAYKDIVNNALGQIREGKLEFDKAEDYILTEIGNRLNEFFGAGFSDMKVEELIKLYDARVQAAYGVENDDASLAQHRQAAIDFCEALAVKGEAYQKAIVKAFGENWRDKINTSTPAQIKPLMDKLKTEARKIGDIEDYKCSWSNVNNKTLGTGVTDTFTVSANITNANGGTVDMSNVTYDATITGNGGKGSINPSTGEITLTTNATGGTINIEVVAMYNGVAIGEPKTITVTVSAEANNVTGNVDSIFTPEQLAKDVSLNTGLNKAMVVSASKKSPEAVLEAAYTALAVKIDDLAMTLKSKGYKSTQVDAAATTLKNYYKAMLAQVKDPDNNGYRSGRTDTAYFSYVDANGTTRSGQADYTHVAKDNVRDDHATNTSSGITLIEGRGSNHGYRVEVNMQVVAQKLIEFFNSFNL